MSYGKTTSYLDIKIYFNATNPLLYKPSDCLCFTFLIQSAKWISLKELPYHSRWNPMPQLVWTQQSEYWGVLGAKGYIRYGILVDTANTTKWLIWSIQMTRFKKYWMDNWIVLLTGALSLETCSSVQTDEKHTSQDLSTLKEVEKIYLLESGHLASISQRM